MADNGTERVMSEADQEAVLSKKYGGMLPKKPLMSKKVNHERAYFDSADWALNKQKGIHVDGVPPKEGDEELPPKLEPTPHTPLPARRPSYADGE